MEIRPTYQHQCIQHFYAGIWNYFIFVLSIVGKFQKYKLKWKKNTMTFYCSSYFHIEPSALINISEPLEGNISQPLGALPHYLFIGFCLLLSVRINMTHCHTYSRSGDDIF